MSTAALLLPVPPLLLLAGAILAARPLAARVMLQRVLALCLALAATGVAAVLALWLYSVPQTLVFTVSPWEASVFGGGPELRVDLLAALWLFLVCGVSLTAVVRGWAGDDDSAAAGPLLVAAASALFVTAADSPLGLVFSWLLLDLALFVSSGAHDKGWLIGQLGLALALIGLLRLPFEPGVTNVGISDIDASGRWWLLGAAAVRMGLHPLWWSLPRTGNRPWRSLGLRLAPTLGGAYVVVRLIEGLHPFEVSIAHTLIPAALALLGGGVLAWLAAQRAESMDWQLTCHAALVVAATIIGGSVGMGIAIVLVIDLALARLVLYAGEGIADNTASRLARWTAAASASALPPTLGFAARWLLYRELLAQRMYGVLLLAVVASAFATMALWDTLRVRAPTGRASRTSVAVLLVPSVMLLLLGIEIGWVRPLIEALGARAPVSPLVEMASMLTKPQTAADAVQLLALILLPTLLALLVRRSPLGWMDHRRRNARHVLRLTPLVKAGSSALVRAGETVHRATGLLESERAMAWTLMAAAVTGTAMLMGSTDVGSGASPTWTWTTSVPFAVACVLSALMLFGTSPGMCLLALAGGYLLSMGVLLRTDTLALVGLIQLVVGALVISILVVSVLQASGATAIRELMGRLFTVSSRAFEEGSPGMMALVLAVGLTLALGVRAQTLSDVLPDDVLRAGLAVIVGGALTSVFARHPLRLAAAVLYTLAGFGMVYAHADPGIFITGFLAAFHMLFALVASYHVGLAVEAENP